MNNITINEWQNPNFLSRENTRQVILSLDQGTQITGYAIYNNGILFASGTISVKNKDTRQRMYEMCEGIKKIAKQYKPTQIVLEEPFAKVNLRVFQILCEFFGIVLYVAHELHIPVASYTAAVWRAEIELKGKNREDQKEKAIERVALMFDRECTDDEAEAILIGYSHIKREERYEDTGKKA